MFLSFWVTNMKIYIFDGQRPSLQHECAVLGLFFKLVSVAAGVDRLGTVFNQKNRDAYKYYSKNIEKLTSILYNNNKFTEFCQKLYKKDFPFTERTLHYLRITLIVKNVGSAL